MTGTITVDGRGGNAFISLSSNNPAVQVPSDVSVTGTATTATFPTTTTAVLSPVTVTLFADELYVSGGVYRSIEVTTTLTVTPAPPVLTSIAVSPASATLTTGGTQAFTAVAYDQNGAALATQPAFTWTNTGVGMITSAGVYSAGPSAGSATVQATSGTVSGTAAVTVNAAVPLYLSNLTLNSTAIIGGTGTTGTVTLSSPAPAGGITVALHSSNAAVTLSPSPCIVSAGATQAAFTITTTAVSASTDVTLSGLYNGWIQGDVLSVLPSIPPTVPPPGTPLIHVAPGNGCAIISWNRLADGTVSGYNVYRVSGSTKTLLTPTPFKSNYYPIMGLTNDTATYTYQVAAVDTQGKEQALSAPVSVTPSSAAVTMNWITPPSAVTDDLTMNVSLSPGGQIFGAAFCIDGVEAGGGGGQSVTVNGVQTHVAGARYDSTKLSNGPHTVQFLGFADFNRTVAAVTSLIPIQVSNTISSDSIIDDWFTPGQGELCYVSATVPAGSTWTVQAIPQDGTTILRTWQGASSLVKLAWDGKDASGNPLPLADYALQLTVQPPGTSPQATIPPGVNTTPNAAGGIKKTHPVKMLQGQPIGLALVSIGASYYLDSNKIPVETSAQDIMLSNVVTSAYTTLFGAGNFQIIRSDTFDPDHVDKKGITDLAKLKGWLGIARVFYLFGHGAGTDGSPGESQTPRSTMFGDYLHKIGLHMEFFPSIVAFSPGPIDIIVPTYVQIHNYVFAWLDSCNSAGGDSVLGKIGTADYGWATAFNATTFMGYNGFMIINDAGPTATSPWYKWRNTFWNNLAKGQNITQAYLTCWTVDGVGPGGTHFPYGYVDTGTYYSNYVLGSISYDCTPGDGYGGTPRVTFYGEPDITTLVPQ